jgi:RNA polymerase primary sigma factor
MKIINKTPLGGEETLVPYLKELGKRDLLTHEEEIALAKRIEQEKKIPKLTAKRRRFAKRGMARKLGCEIRRIRQDVDEAKQEMIRKNLRLVISVAKRYANVGLPLPDLIQEGNIGLMRAVEKFDHRLGTRFATYAVWWIRQAITRTLSNRSRTIRIPVHVLAAQSKLARTSRSLFHELGREPTPEECAEEMKLSAERLETISQTVPQPVSLEKPVGEDGDSVLSEFIADPNTPNPGEVLTQSRMSERVLQVLGTLTPREEKILRLRFGIGEDQEHTLEEVGKTFRVTRERIRQIEEKALKKLGRGFRGERLKAIID